MNLTIARYLTNKIEELGIKDVFGLPGDYNFNILDTIIKAKNLNWINCTNELNAGYAADGYARIKGYGALVTTYGVGELSAINAHSGAYAENVPIIHIAGVPKKAFIENNSIVHHNFSNPDYYVFERIFKNVSSYTAFLTKENAKFEIDKAINILINKKQPVYIALPHDLCCEPIEVSNTGLFFEKSDENNLNAAFFEIENLLLNAKSPILFIDYLIKRYNLEKEIDKFICKTNIKASAFLMGKGALNEESPNFIGIYTGNYSSAFLLNEIKNSDLLITAGFLNSDLNTGGFSAFEEKTPDVKIEKERVIVKNKIFQNVLIQDIIKLLAKKSRAEFFIDIKPPAPSFECPLEGDFEIACDNILPKIETVFDKGDIFLMDMGIMGISAPFLKLKNEMEYLSQTLWGSIGWATPAAFGTAMAAKNRNVILFTGEGAQQLTIQELSNFFEQNLCPVIFVLNNKGYTIERALSADKTDKFNDIINWDYSKILEGFSGGKPYFYKKCKTSKELNSALFEVKKRKGGMMCYIEILSDKYDFTKYGLKIAQNICDYYKKLNSKKL